MTEAIHTLHSGDFRIEIATETDRLQPRFGPRFDRTAQVTRVSLADREFAHPWGWPDEFGLKGQGVLGFDEAKPGGPFVKIGVGTLRRDRPGDYSFAHAYPVADTYPVRVGRFPSDGDDAALGIEQVSPLVNGFGYYLSKRFRLLTAGVLAIDYELTNRGERAFAFEHYNHHFLSFDGTAADASYSITPDFQLAGDPPGPWQRERHTLRLRETAPVQGGVYWGAELAASPKMNRVSVAHAGGLCMTTTGNAPVSRFALWAIRETLCPEVFYRETLAPGATARWLRRYACTASD